ncbi:MAG: glycosyltransferase [Kiritimatiellae bacterium]|nr:glycosyltransferase [Kiritimatiellia bacterium]
MKDIARPDIKPAFAERNVPIALATDENYLPYLKVAINSAIANSPGSNLDIIVLHAGIAEDAILDFTARYAGTGNASVRFVDISEELVASGLSGYKQTARLPLSSCYRLLLPRILPAYGKIVYIDVDVAVCRDLGELYSTDVGDSWFAAAKDIVESRNSEYLAWAAKWGFTEYDGYVNAGVLVMNLERFRREPVLDRLKEIVFEAAKWNCDQDALNFVCKGAIAPLDPRWNVQLGDYCLEKQIAMTGEEMWVAHYTGSQKPWKLPARRYSHLWWRHAVEPDVSRLWTDTLGEESVQPVAGVPKMSVIIPVYNSARYLPEALASVLMQKDFPAIELVCIDDGSTDDSAAILDFWEKRDSRLKVLRQANAGPGVARNAGLDIARGEYICFLDADDRISSGAALRETLEQAKADDLDILIAAGAVMAEDGNVERRDAYLNRSLLPATRVFGPEALATGLYLVAPMTPWAKLFRRKFLEEKQLRFPPLKRSEDFPFVQLALSLAGRIGVASQSIVDHRVEVATSLETTKDETPLIFAEAERIFRKSLSKRGLLSQFRRAADVSSVVRLAYNLRSVRRFANFRVVAQYCAAEFPKFEIKGDESGVMRFAEACKCVCDIVALADDPDGLADAFADILAAKVCAPLHSKLEKLAAERDAERQKAVRMRVERDSLKKALDATRAELSDIKKMHERIAAICAEN